MLHSFRSLCITFSLNDAIVKRKFGFTLIVHNKLFDQLRFIQRAMLLLETPTDLVFIERFKVIADKKGNNATI